MRERSLCVGKGVKGVQGCRYNGKGVQGRSCGGEGHQEFSYREKEIQRHTYRRKSSKGVATGGKGVQGCSHKGKGLKGCSCEGRKLADNCYINVATNLSPITCTYTRLNSKSFALYKFTDYSDSLAKFSKHKVRKSSITMYIVMYKQVYLYIYSKEFLHKNLGALSVCNCSWDFPLRQHHWRFYSNTV